MNSFFLPLNTFFAYQFHFEFPFHNNYPLISNSSANPILIRSILSKSSFLRHFACVIVQACSVALNAKHSIGLSLSLVPCLIYCWISFTWLWILSLSFKTQPKDQFRIYFKCHQLSHNMVKKLSSSRATRAHSVALISVSRRGGKNNGLKCFFLFLMVFMVFRFNSLKK